MVSSRMANLASKNSLRDFLFLFSLFAFFLLYLLLFNKDGVMKVQIRI